MAWTQHIWVGIIRVLDTVWFFFYLVTKLRKLRCSKKLQEITCTWVTSTCFTLIVNTFLLDGFHEMMEVGYSSTSQKSLDFKTEPQTQNTKICATESNFSRFPSNFPNFPLYYISNHVFISWPRLYYFFFVNSIHFKFVSIDT